VKPRKVVILGGGMAGLTTAWRLSNDPHWRQQFESITVHQMGWRLGGKCATGRGPAGRIEEHGIHLFGGGYYNTLLMMRDVCREAFPGTPGEFAHRFERQFTSIDVADRHKSVTVLAPGALALDDAHRLDTPQALFACAITSLLAQLRLKSVPGPRLVSHFSLGGLPDLPWLQPARDLATSAWLDLVQALGEQIRTQSAALPATLDRLAAIVGPARGLGAGDFFSLLDGDDHNDHPHDHPGGGFAPLTAARARLAAHPFGQWMGLLNFAYAIGRGYHQDFVLQRKTFSALDDEDHAAWLRRHGAWDSTLDLDITLSPIRILYQYRGGDASAAGQRSMGAGAYLHWTLRTLAYVESPFWFFQQGTGDTVITPLYSVLAQRGVQFEFFHKVESLQLSADGQRVAQVTLRQQATTLTGQPYEPLEHGEWPARPRDDTLTQGDEIAQLPADELESYWSAYRADRTVTLAEGGDFDELVLAISLGALPLICDELLQQDQPWRDMVARVKTVETQSMQLWFDQTSQDLGIQTHANRPIPDDDTGLGAGLATPYDGFSDFSSLIPFEHWPPAGRPKALWYFSDVIATAHDVSPVDDPAYPQRRREDAFANAKQFLAKDIGRLLSQFSTGFNYQRLVSLPGHPPPASHDERLAQQLVRANFQPSDRYVQALAGSTKFRLDAGRSPRFANLSLAGDWTYNGLNVGCVEAAVMSGLLAANRLLGRPHAHAVVAYFGR
jgi:uncharacterized protein with NAD-binding domain and iron-sulfur cluster